MWKEQLFNYEKIDVIEEAKNLRKARKDFWIQSRSDCRTGPVFESQKCVWPLNIQISDSH